MNINPVVFREYDIRGVVDRDLNEDFAFLLGRAYSRLLPSSGPRTVAIGRDCRLTSEAYAQALADGLSSMGVEVVLTGMGPTPQLYFAVFTKDVQGGIQVTGSHNPADMNGFKLCVGTQTLSGSQIQDLKRLVLEEASTFRGDRKTAAQASLIRSLDIRDEYISYLVENAKPFMGGRKLKVVCDAGNGVGGLVGPAVLRALGVEVIELFCEPDGRFPNHHPDPTVLENIETLIEKVRETKADFGIGWDGDADRIGVVDDKGEVMFGDMLLLVYARDILKQEKGATIIGDVKCSSRLFEDIKRHGGNPIMWKTGHSLIKNKLRETGAALAGEMSGHIFFKHRYFGFDDAIYASVRLAEIMSNTTQRASELLADLPHMVSTPEIRVDCPEDIKFKIPDLVVERFNGLPIDRTDGLRISFDQGWGLIRASNTQPALVLRFEAANEQALNEYETRVKETIATVCER